MGEEIPEKDNRLSREDLSAQIYKEFEKVLTNENVCPPHIGIHLMIIRQAMGISPKKASTMLGMTPRLLAHYEVGTKEPKGEDRKRIIAFINRFAREVGYRGRTD